MHSYVTFYGTERKSLELPEIGARIRPLVWN